MSKKEEKKVKKVKNKEKVDTGEIKPKWKLWMTIVSVILGIGLIAGATLLGVYLSRGGQTGETPVYPSGITFVQDDSYLELYNQANGQLEVTDNFTLTITSTDTEAVVNQRSVNLSLDGNSRTSPDGKYISNGVIRVPSVVQLNTPFSVELITEHLQDENGEYILENGEQVDWIAGGIATITARSAYSQSQASAINVKVAVDVPVYSTEAIILNDDGNPAEKIVIGETFTIQTKFIPAKSEYMYSDDVNSEQGNITSENVRKKLAFYQSSSDNVTPVYDTSTTMHFVAGDDIVDGVQLNAYVFKDAKSQLIAEQELAESGVTNENYYTQMVSMLASSQDSAYLTSTRIDIGTADVSAFNISLANSFDIIQNYTTRIYVSNQVSGSINVGAYVQDSNLMAVPSMLSNVLLSFSYTDRQGQTIDPTLGNDAFLQVSGGDVVVIDGQTYYRPYSEGLSNKGNSYWSVISSQVATIQVKVGLLIELENGEIGLYQSNGAPLLFESTMNVTEHTEQNVYWSGIESLDIMLDYLGDGSIDSQTEDLNQYMYVPEQNIYKEPKYLFAYFGEGVDTSTVISILGNGGFNSERSGLYSVGLEELYLYCIESTSLTVYNTGLFDLYFATIMVQDGVPVVSENGLYRIARMSEAISVDVKKELSQDSVIGATMSMGQFVVNEDNQMYYIDLGNNGTFSISFIVNSDSVEVFSEQLGSMTLTIYDSYNQVISTITQSVSEGNFILVRSDFSINQEEGYGVFTFELQLNPTTTIVTQNDDLGVIVNSFTLTYNTQDENNIVWGGGNGFRVSDLLENQTVMIYDPIAQSITLEYDPNDQIYLTGDSEITVNQTLDAESGETVLNISLGGTPIEAQDGQSALTALFNRFFGENFANIVITDQVGRTDTLAGEWSFRLLEGSSHVVAVQGQTIQFINGNGSIVVIDIVSLDGNVETGSADDVIKMKFNVTSTGITDVFFNSNLDPNSSITEGTNQEESESTISVAMSKYGASNNTIILANQVRLEVNGVQFTKIQFTLSTSYLENLGSAIVDLFGTDGMLTVYNNGQKIQTGTDASTIRSNLQGKVITSIQINKNFYQSRSVQLTISDEANSGVVNITLNMTILPNIAISGATTYGSTTDSSSFIYATAEEGDSEGTQISNMVTNKNDNAGTQSSFGSLYTTDTYYIVPSSGQYVLNTLYTGNEVGEMVVDGEGNATIRFYDFWDTDYKQFSVVFQPEGNNQYAISYTLTFIILRDLDLDKLAKDTDTFYILNKGETPKWTDFIQYMRHDGSPIEDIEFSGEFEDYLTINGSNVELLNSSAFIFEYNTTSYATKLSLMLNGNALGSVDVYIELYNTEDQTIYEYIASQIQISKDNVSYNPTTQIVDGVEYIMLVYDTSAYTLPNSRSDNNNYFDSSYTMYIRNADTANTYYSTGENQNTFTLRSQNQLLGGLGNENSYLVLYFNQGSETGSTNAKAIMYVPLINSAIGYNFVKYSSGVEDNRTLETALTDPSELLKQGIYNEITAGQATQIIKEVSYYENSTGENGLIRPIRDGGYSVTPTITYYPTVTDGTNLTNKSIIKGIDSNNGYLDLNHLTNDTLYENFYLGLSYNINYNGRYQIFYYLLKIIPDINVEASTYAYTNYGEKGEEHIRVDQNSRQTFDLDKIYDETTLNEGFSRFNVSKMLSSSITILVVDVRSSSKVSLAFKVSGSYTENDETKYFTDQMVILDNITSDCAINISKTLDSYLCLQLCDIFKVTSVNIESVELIVRSGSCYIYDGSSLKLTFTQGIYTDSEGSNAVAEFISEQDSLGTSSVNRAIFANLVSTNVIESVKVGGQDPYTFPEQWAEDITFYNVNGNVIEGSTFDYVVKTSERIEIVIKRTYESDTSLEQKYKRSIYGAEQYYTIILNDENNSSYNARFTTNEGNVQSVYDGVYTWELKNAVAETGDSRDRTLTVQLVSNSTAGQETTTGTVVPDLLQIKLVDGNEDVDFESYAYNTHSYIDDKGLSPYQFKLTLKDYISKDTTIKFSVYTQYGYLATLRINIKANASYARKMTEGENPVEVASNLVGGQNINFSKVYDIKLNNAEATGYTVTAEMRSANNNDHKFVKIENNQFVVADIVSDKTVTFKYTITFLDAQNEPTDKKFTFTDTLTFKRNISVQAITGESSLAGQNYDLIANDNNPNKDYLYINASGTAIDNDRTTLTYSASSTSSAVDTSMGIFADSKSTSVTIKDISSEMQSVSINITMHFAFSASTEGNKPTESITFTYTFNVYKAVTVDTNYPVPDDKTELEIEYFENGSVINNALSDFILSNPIYNIGENANRFTAYRNNLNADKNGTVQGSQITEGLTADTISVVIQEIQNATIWQYSRSGIGDTQYYASNAIALGQGLYLRRGTYSQTNDTDKDKTDQNDYVTSGERSVIIFEITYREATTTYTIELLDSVFTIPAIYTKYATSGVINNKDGTTSTVTHETIYVDKTNTNDIFSGDRMFQVQIANTLTNSDTYYLVFKDTKDQFYASYAQYISLEDQGSNQYLDLGYSMQGKEYFGTYRASAIENAGIGFDGYGLMQKTKEDNSGKEAITEDDLESITNVDVNNALFTTKQLVSRIQLYYGGNKVDYSYFEENLTSDYNVDTSSAKINEIKSLNPISQISVANGVSQVVITTDTGSLTYEDKLETGYTKPLLTTYYFMPRIDIEVEEAFTVNNYTEVTVNRTYSSIVQQLGIKHPTNDSYVSASDFGDGKATIQFEIIYYSTDYTTNVPETSVQNSLEAFMTLNGIDEFKHYATYTGTNYDQGTNEYIAYSPMRNASGAIYDASVMPLGAQVNGDFVLSKITYRSDGGYSETFYVVYKVMPDYIVSFSGSTENKTISTDEEGFGVVSNVNNPFGVYSVTSEGNYSAFTLTSTDSTKGELSIKHQYGNNTSTEYSTSNFDITLTLNQTISGRAINNKDNFDQKFAYSGSSNLKNWQKSEIDGKTTGYAYKTADGNRQTSAITFGAVKEVIFGNQYYMIEGVDVYGYKYQFYFYLRSQYTQPSIASTGQNPVLKELDYFDIGSIYTMLNIEYSAGSAENDPGSYAINTNDVSPVSSAEVPLINIANVGTYFFDRDYAQNTNGEGQSNQYLEKNDDDGYKAVIGDNPGTQEKEDDYDQTSMWPTQATSYFNSPNFKYVTVDSANFYSINKEDNTADQWLSTATMPKATFYTLAEKSGSTWSTNYGSDDTALSYTLKEQTYKMTVTAGSDVSLTIKADTTSITNEIAKDITANINSLLPSGIIAEYDTFESNTNELTVKLDVGDATKVELISVSNEYDLATTTTQNAFFNGLEDKIREPFISGTFENEFGSEVQQAIQVPAFAGEVYANSTETDMILVIRLKYENNGTVEYTDLQTTVTVVREVQIVEIDKVVADGEGITLSSVFTVADGQGTNLVEDTSYLNDTLELLIKAQSTARFNISLTRDNATFVSDVSVSRSNYDSYDKTTYLSISSLLNTSVQSGDTITISNANGNATFYYIYPDNQTQSGEKYTGTGDSGGSKGILTFVDIGGDEGNKILDGAETITFKIQAITNDYIYVENAQRLSGSNSYYTIDKYYIAQVKKDASSEETLNYRVSHRYYVTGKYYSMSGATTDQIIRRLLNSGTDDNIFTSLSAWTPANPPETNSNAVLTLRDAEVNNTTVSNGSVKGFNKDYIWFMIDPLGGSGSGDVSINNDYSKRNENDYNYGRITYGPKYTYDQYIEIVFRVVVSGADRDISTLDNGYDVGNVNISYELGSILVGWAEDFRA